MRLRTWIRSLWPPKGEGQPPPASLRDRIAVLLALVTFVCVAAGFFLSKGTRVLMPGPLTSAHGAIETCSACHSKSGSGKLSFLRGLVPGDPHADSEACLTCHKMPDTAFNAHGATALVLKESTERLAKNAAATPEPQSARAQSVAFSTHRVAAGGLECAACHQEHQGASFDLAKISNEQCRSCHVVRFDSFDGHHPKFESYPFKRRTPIIYDHAGHFGKHFPEVAKKNPAKSIPATCSTCHDSREDRRLMAVAPFEKTCTACHLDQIVGKERASGPKGIAFLAVPGLDLPTLKKKNASVGEWPEASEADLTPFMKVMISRSERGRALIRTVDGLNLQDLTKASDAQIQAAASLAWEIKRLFHALIKGKASDVLGDLNLGGGAKLSATLVADLTASIPRDVVVSAQQEWLPNLAAEMANGAIAREQEQSSGGAAIDDPKLDRAVSGSDTRQAASKRSAKTIASEGPEPRSASGKTGTADAKPQDRKETPSAERPKSASDDAEASGKKPGSDAPGEAGAGEDPAKAKLDPPVCALRLFGQCLVSNGQANSAVSKLGAGLSPPMRAGIEVAENGALPEDGGPIIRRWSLPGGTSRAIEGDAEDAEEAAEPERRARKAGAAKAKPDDGDETRPSAEKPRASKPELKDAEKAAQSEGAGATTDAASSKSDGAKEPTSNEPPRGKTGSGPADDLLFPTEEELRAIKAGAPGKAVQPEKTSGESETANTSQERGQSADATAAADTRAPPPAVSDAAAAKPQARDQPVISIESDVDPESWAEYGGWYRQDYAIFYRPTGHKDKFIYSWLFLTGPQAPKGDKRPAAAVFDALTGKDAQGSCTKCHSVDDLQGKGRLVNFSPPKAESKRGRFTSFIHEPHMGIMENRGCLTCHALEKGRPYLKGYEQGNPREFVSNFGEVKKDLCQTCHSSSLARQDCLTCHTYHVNGVVTPIMSTKLPAQ